MFSDKCPICSTQLSLFCDLFEYIYYCGYCSNNIANGCYYSVIFDMDNELVSETYYTNNIQIETRFKSKCTEIIFRDAGFSAIIPCYLGYGKIDIDKIKSYMMMA